MADERAARVNPCPTCGDVDGSRTMQCCAASWYAFMLSERNLTEAVADRCGRREGETVAELLKRLYDETLDDEN